jgi:colicin import membrane protein
MRVASLRLVPLVAALLCALPTAVLAAPDTAAAQERQRLAAERQAVEARFAAEDADCRQRFMVTDCVDDVRQRRRDALAGLREQELALEDAERRARVAERQRAVARKSAEAASRPASGPISAPIAAPTPFPLSPLPDLRPPVASSSAPAASAAIAADPVRRNGPDPEAARDAARRASAAEQRRQDAEAERARIAAREAERAARGKPVAPLPLPAELAGSGATR